jgi:hypothetical protein
MIEIWDNNKRLLDWEAASNDNQKVDRRKPSIDDTRWNFRDNFWISISDYLVPTHFGVDRLPPPASKKDWLARSCWICLDPNTFNPPGSPELAWILSNLFDWFLIFPSGSTIFSAPAHHHGSAGYGVVDLWHGYISCQNSSVWYQHFSLYLDHFSDRDREFWSWFLLGSNWF